MNYLTDTRRRALRAGIVVTAIPAAWIAVWGLAAPRSWFDGFPGGGHHWVSALGPYNEHLVRDVAAFELGLVALAVFAIVTLDRRVVQATLVAYAVSGLPHLIYHLTTTGPFSTLDNVLSLVGLALGVAIPLALLPMTRSRRVTA